MKTTLRLRSPLLLVAMLLLAASTGLRAQCPGTLAQWLYRVPVTINNPGAPVTNYYALFKFNSSTPISQSKMRADGGDIRVADASCNLVNFWIQSGLNTGTTVIWAKIPTLPTGSTTFYIYYGNASAVFSNNASNVFGTGIIALYTFTEGSGGTLTDWVGGFNMTVTGTWTTGFRTGVSAVTGFTSGGRVFFGGAGPSVNSGSFTAITYIFPTSPSGNTQGIIGNYNNDGASGWVLKQQGTQSGCGTGSLELLTNASGNWCQGGGNGCFLSGQWQQAAGRRDVAATHTLFVNNTGSNDACSGDSRNVDGSGPFELGHSYNQSYAYAGSISMTMVFNTAVNDATIQGLHDGLFPSPEPIPSVGVEETVAPPVITQQPQSVTICSGQTATFTVAATGQALTYQWRKNGTPILGATGTSYTIVNAQPTDAGVYDALVRNQVATTGALLTVNTAPGIITQPVSLPALCPGSQVSFTVGAAGGFLTYQWRKAGVPIVGATSTTYTIPSAQITDIANYDVVVSGVCGSPVTSTTATFSLLGVPGITSQPVNQTVCRTQTATFTVGTSGAGLTYQWRRNGTPLEGATNPTISITAQPYSAGSYDVVVSGTCGAPATSNPATLTVALDPIITEQPLDKTAQSGQRIVFSVKTMGGGVLSYQWYKNGVALPGRISDTLIVQSSSAGDVGDYYVVIRGTLCSDQLAVSNKASLLLDVPPVIVKDPENASACSDGSIVLTVTAAGTGLSYQWRHNGVNIPGATGHDYKITNVAAADSGNYDVVIKGANNVTLTSTPAKVSVNLPAAVATQPTDVTVCPGKPANFTVGATGTALTYQWHKNGTDLTGANAATYAIAAAAASDTGMYDVMVIGTCGDTIASNSARLILNELPTITEQPTAVTTGIGQPVTFTVKATGTNLTYQWRKDGANIPGATASVYSIPAVTSDQAGNYDVVVTGLCEPTSTSTAVALVVRTSSVPGDLTPETGAMLTVVPQPAHGVTSLQVHLPQGVRAHAGASLVLFDINGKQMLDLSNSFAGGNFQSAEFDASALASGTYYVRLTTPEWNGTLGTVVVRK